MHVSIHPTLDNRVQPRGWVRVRTVCSIPTWLMIDGGERWWEGEGCPAPTNALVSKHNESSVTSTTQHHVNCTTGGTFGGNQQLSNYSCLCAGILQISHDPIWRPLFCGRGRGGGRDGRMEGRKAAHTAHQHKYIRRRAGARKGG